MLTGNIIVGQSGGPTAVINSSLAGVFKTAKDRNAKTVYGMRNGIQGFLDDRFIDMSKYISNGLDIELLKRTPSSYLGSCRFKLPDPEKNEEVFVEIFKKLNKLEIEHFFYIGGNDSMDTIKKLSHYAKATNQKINFMGVPKTIDNDLAMTDHTPGFGSASKYIAAVMKEIIRDGRVYDVNNVTVVEIMGRNAGWLTAAAALGKTEECDGPDMIYLPEMSFDPEKFIQQIKERQSEKKALVIAVSEGLKTADGKYVCELSKENVSQDSFGHKALGGTACFLTDFISQRLGCKTRSIEFSTLQRCASHIVSLTDVNEAFIAGAQAVRAAFDGETAKMIIFKRLSNDPYDITTGAHDVNEIANAERIIPREWITECGTGVTKDFIDYVYPLIQGELSPIMADGLPRHLVLPNNV